MSVTMEDVAKRAGVSVSAVSRTFTPGASVSNAMRARVEEAARALGYETNVLASSLTTGRTKLIGLISNNFTNPYFLEIFDGFTRALQEADLRPLLLNLSDEDNAERALAKLRQYSVDGAIVASSTLPPRFAASFQTAGIPVVHAFGWSSPVPDSTFVGIDNVAAGRVAAQTLVARGYRKVGFLGGPEEAATTAERLSGFNEALAEAGLSPTVRYADDYSYAAGATAMEEALSGPMVEAWFCGDDVIAIGAAGTARARALAIPQDIGFLGLNDMAMAGWAGIELTTISQPRDAIVATAVEIIERAIADPENASAHRLLPFTIVERGTLRPLN